MIKITPKQIAEESIINSSFCQPIFITGENNAERIDFMNEIERIVKQNTRFINLSVNDDQSFNANVLEQLRNNLPMSDKFKLFGAHTSIKKLPKVTQLRLIKETVIRLNHLDKIPVIYVDTVSGPDNIQEFMQSYMTLKRLGHQIFIIMTGTPNAVKSIKNTDGITFLWRAKTIKL